MHVLTKIRLHHILFLALTTISAVPVIILSSWVQSTTLENQVHAIEEKHLLLARNLTGTLTRYANDISSTLKSVAKYYHDGESVELLSELFHGLQIDLVWVIDEEAEDETPRGFYPTANKSRIPNNLFEMIKPFIKQAQDNPDKVIFSKILANSKNESVLYALQSLSDDRLLIAMINTRFFISLQKSISFGERGHAAIVDYEGSTIAHPSEKWMKTRKDITALAAVKYMTEGKTGVAQFYSPVMQADMVAGYSVVKGVGWGVMIPQPYDELLDEANRSQFVATLIAIIGITVAGFISWWLARFMCRPIVAVAESARDVASGDHASRIRGSGAYAPAELKDLTESFNLMVDEINVKNETTRIANLRLEAAQRIAHLGNWEWDFINNVFWCSDEVYRIFGYAPGTEIENFDRFFGMTHPDDQPYLKSLFENARKRKKSFSIDYRIVLADNTVSYLHQEVKFHNATDDKASYLSGVVHEITEQKKYEETLLKQANYDELTGLANRSLYFDRLSAAIKQAHRNSSYVAVLFIDIDDFKVVNDTHGHMVGDKLLKHAAERITETVREADTVARIGGDEFMIILHEIKKIQDAGLVASKIIKNLAEIYVIDSIEAYVGSSIGITVFPFDAQDVMTLHRNADIAMYRAKESGKNMYQYFTSEMNDQVYERSMLVNDLRSAIEQDQFAMHFQPIIDAESRKVVAAEALIRWIHPQRGFVPPDKFIPTAEDTGAINDIGIWALRDSCKHAVDWVNSGHKDFRVSVNVSPHQIRKSLTKKRVTEILKETGLDAGNLSFEITESMVMGDIEQAISWMNEMKELGIMIYMDDFGTGYSSLSYLKRLPVDVLKIDRSFVNGITVNKEDDLLISAIIAMAKSLNLCLVAEGVETEAQFNYLHQLECDRIQGYLFSKPLVGEEFTEFLQQNS